MANEFHNNIEISGSPAHRLRLLSYLALLMPENWSLLKVEVGLEAWEVQDPISEPISTVTTLEFYSWSWPRGLERLSMQNPKLKLDCVIRDISGGTSYHEVWRDGVVPEQDHAPIIYSGEEDQ
jgi:hypothetical protein